MFEERGPLHRYEGNPILTPEKMPFRCYTVMNSGAIRYQGQYLLLLRVEDCTRATDFYVATSENGLDFEVSPDPIDYPPREIEKRYGGHRFDPRITSIDGRHYICHALWLGPLGCCLAMAVTDDFVHFGPFGEVSLPSNRNGALFPEKVGGKYYRLERPQPTKDGGTMWITESEDLIRWGNGRPIDTPQTSWASIKTGAGAVPIRTPEGWLEIYHAVCSTCSSNNYHLGVVLLDLDEPWKVVRAPREFVLAAERDYECMGQTPNVVFTAGACETDDGKLNVYYGGADTRMCLAQTCIEELIDFCRTAK